MTDLAAMQQQQIEALLLQRYRIENARRWLNLTQCADEYDSLGRALDQVNAEIAMREAELRNAEEASAP